MWRRKSSPGVTSIMAAFWTGEPAAAGPMPMLAAPPVLEAFSRVMTRAPLSAAATDAASPDRPAAMTTTSVSSCFMVTPPCWEPTQNVW